MMLASVIHTSPPIWYNEMICEVRKAMKPQSYPQLQKRYGGQFVASYRGRVIATAKTSKALFKKISDYLGDPALFIQYIAPQSAVCIY